MGVHSVLFEVGFVTRESEAMLVLVLARLTESSLIQRHEQGDFGDADTGQCLCNLHAIGAGEGVVRSLYRLPTGPCVCVETDLVAGETYLRLPYRSPTAAPTVPGIHTGH